MSALADLLRLCCLPVLGWAAYCDLRTRRVSNRTWLPLIAIGGALLVWETWSVWSGARGAEQGLFTLRVAVSIGVVAPLGYLFWHAGAFGGADAKALVALCVLFPTPPSYSFLSTTLPLAVTSGVFSLSILTNAALAGGVYPLWLFCRNAHAGRFSSAMFVGVPVGWRAIPETHGRLLGSTNGLDLDALRMYLVWRDATLDELRRAPGTHRDPASLPVERNPPGDGAVGMLTDGGEPTVHEDPWGAAAFLEDAGDAYGTTPDGLRRALDVLVTRETVWITPGVPFLVPLFAGLCVALVYGDLLYGVMGALGMI